MSIEIKNIHNKTNKKNKKGNKKMNQENVRNEPYVFGCDDISALVVDLGFQNSKIGYCQQDTPSIFLESICGEDVSTINKEEESHFENNCENNKGGEVSDTSKLKYPLNIYNMYENIKIKPLFYREENGNDGFVGKAKLNADVFEKILEYSIEGTNINRVYECSDEILGPTKFGGLHSKLEEHPMLLTESDIHNNPLREEITEILFEKYNIPAIYFGKEAKLTSFSLGRSSSLVVDIGATCLKINTVYEGCVLQKNAFECCVGGNYLDRIFLEELQKNKIEILPFFYQNNVQGETCLRENKRVHPTYQEEGILNVIRYLKESICLVQQPKRGKKRNSSLEEIANSVDKNEKGNVSISKEYNGTDSDTEGVTYNGRSNQDSFDLPDGTKVSIDEYKYLIPEYLFKNNSTCKFKGLSENIIDCIMMNDVDIRKDLTQSIIVTGSSSLFKGLCERLHTQLREADCFSQTSKLKVLNLGSQVENSYSSWLGGSILASLGTLMKLWVSKQEYMDSGVNIVYDRCF